MPFRSQEYAPRCAVCQQAAAIACRQCRLPICELHACAPHGSCEQCATEMYFAVSRAGKRHLKGGAAVAFVSAIGFYTVNALPLIAPAAVAVLVLGVVAGIGTVLWGGSVSPRLAERALLRRPHRRGLLPSPDRPG